MNCTYVLCNQKIDSRRKTRKYCSNKCQANNRWFINKSKIKFDLLFTGSRQARKYLFEELGKLCSICSLSTWNNQEIPLVLDHINGNPDDWSITNCRLLCPNCDAQTPTYKSKNLGHGRHSRRLRYQQGKSY